MYLHRAKKKIVVQMNLYAAPFLDTNCLTRAGKKRSEEPQIFQRVSERGKLNSHLVQSWKI